MSEKYEMWKSIPLFPGYEISTHGRIRSWKKTGPGGYRRNEPLIMTPQFDSDGYLYVNLIKEGKYNGMKIHKAVLLTFVGPYIEGMQGRHLDGIKTNNYPHNLAWGTSKDNSEDMIKHGTVLRGEDCPRAKLIEKQVEDIIHDLCEGKLYQKEIARKYNTGQTNVASIKLNKTWTHILPGLREELVEFRHLQQRRRHVRV